MTVLDQVKRRGGSAWKDQRVRSVAGKVVIYFLLIGIGFVYLYPILYMVLTSLMPTSDLINPTIQWIPTYLDLSNFGQVFRVLQYPSSFMTTVLLAGVSAVFQTLCCALMGYGLARYPVPLKKLWLVILLIVFIIPTDVTMVPRYVLFNNYHLIGSVLAIYLPALLGQGLKSSLFVLIFMQAFAAYPHSYDEAAQLDGAGRLRVFFTIALPLAIPVLVLSLLFSFVWYWNETVQTGLYVGSTIHTLPLQLQSFDSMFGSMYPSTAGSELNRLNERVEMAATILVVAPLVLLYLFLQKQFVRGIEAAGITGE